jgi:YggT family protein
MQFIFNLVDFLIGLYIIILFIRVLLSWMPVDRNNAVVRALYAVTEPLLEPIRNLLPATGGFDFSTMVLIILLVALQRAVNILAS